MKLKVQFTLSALAVLSTPLSASPLLFRAHMAIDAVVVSSTCSIVIEDSRLRGGIINFGEYNKATQSGAPMQYFNVILYEDGAIQPGCSAFLAGSDLVELTFGDRISGQLDEHGVVTQGAGDRIRVAISATDTTQVNTTETITSTNNTLSYPKAFASRGVFGFQAQAHFLDRAVAGTYRGAVSLTVKYQ